MSLDLLSSDSVVGAGNHHRGVPISCVPFTPSHNNKKPIRWVVIASVSTQPSVLLPCSQASVACGIHGSPRLFVHWNPKKYFWHHWRTGVCFSKIISFYNYIVEEARALCVTSHHFRQHTQHLYLHKEFLASFYWLVCSGFKLPGITSSLLQGSPQHSVK